MAAWCCLYWDWLRRVWLHWVDHLGAFKLRRMSLLIAIMIYLLPMMPMMLGLLANGRIDGQSVLIVSESRILGILLMFRVLSRACDLALAM